MKSPKKLIEVALPLDDINVAAAREKSIRHGHPSTLHLWWARRPLAAARAVLFAQLVNDPGGERGWGAYKGQTKEDARKERERLFDIIRELVLWENTNNERVLRLAREEIYRSWRETCRLNGIAEDIPMPPVHDPFAGGGAIPLEAQRLGLSAIASDLNPVAVLISRAMIDLPPRFARISPVGPTLGGYSQASLPKEWPGATGFSEDIQRYGLWMRSEARRRIGHLYPEVDLPSSEGGGKATVIAWIWARTVESPNPALRGRHVPLVSSFWLSKKKGKEVYLEPIVSGSEYRFEVRKGKPKDTRSVSQGTKVGRSGFTCILSGTPIPFDYIRKKGSAGKLGSKLIAIAAEGDRRRLYFPADQNHEETALEASPTWTPEQPLPEEALGFRVQNYGLTQWRDLFTRRQLVALTTFSDLVDQVRSKVEKDAISAGWEVGPSLRLGGNGARAYGDAVAVMLTFAIDKMADLGNSLCGWEPNAQCPRHLFGRQAIPMLWDYAEANPFSSSSGSWETLLDGIVKAHRKAFLAVKSDHIGSAHQLDVRSVDGSTAAIFSTDPPYYDNVPYADLSDFFYIWSRRTLRGVYPDLFNTLLVPKTEELIAEPFRHRGKEAAEQFFLNGMTEAMRSMATASHEAFPVSIYYAFKQSETSNGRTTSTGWETFLQAVIDAGFRITGTWPINTENASRLRGQLSNALASSIVLTCRPRDIKSPRATRRDFLRQLREVMPDSLEDMIGGSEGASPIAPVDLAQAAIGPGMAVYSSYEAVLEADGSKMPVKRALAYINEAIDRYFSEAEGQMDADTRFCIDWFQQFGFKAGVFGDADVLARAKGTSVEGLENAGVLTSKEGKVRLLRINEYSDFWDPVLDKRTPVWEACHQMARALSASEGVAGELLAKMPEKQEAVRQLAYRLYTLCERNGWAQEASQYNLLVGSWHSIVEESHRVGHVGTQGRLEL